MSKRRASSSRILKLPAGFTHARRRVAIRSRALPLCKKPDGRDLLHVKFSGRRGRALFPSTSLERRDAARKSGCAFVGAGFHGARSRAATRPRSASQFTFRSRPIQTPTRATFARRTCKILAELPVKKPDSTPLTLGFRYRGTARPAQVQFELRKSRVSAEVLTSMEVREALLPACLDDQLHR